MNRLIGSVLFVLLLTGAVQAAPNCKAFMDAYDHSSKLISLEGAGGIGDNSVYRAMLQELKISNYYQVRALNLDLMQAHKCPLPTDAVYPSEYLIDALGCATDQVTGNTKSPKCDFKNWKRVHAEE